MLKRNLKNNSRSYSPSPKSMLLYSFSKANANILFSFRQGGNRNKPLFHINSQITRTKCYSCLVRIIDTNNIAIIQFIANGSLDWLFSFSFCNNRYANGSCKKDLFVLNSVSTTPNCDM
jgi:hypothetical protein